MITVFGCMVLIIPGERRLLGEETVNVLKVAPGLPRELALLIIMVVALEEEDKEEMDEEVVVILIP